MGIRFTTFAGGGNMSGDLDQRDRPVRDGAHYVAERNPPGPRGEATEELAVAGPFATEQRAELVASYLQSAHDAAEEAGLHFIVLPVAGQYVFQAGGPEVRDRHDIYQTGTPETAFAFARGVEHMARR